MILVLGSANTDMVVKTPRLPAPGETVLGGTFLQTAGGKGANQAVAAARLGGAVTFCGRVGDDDLGRATRSGLLAEGIDCTYLRPDAGGAASGVALILVDDAGENAIAVVPGANASLTPADAAEACARLTPADLLLVQLEVPLPTVAEAIRVAADRGARVVLNPAPAPAEALADDTYGRLAVVTPNETEAALLTGVTVTDDASAAEAARHLLARGVGAAVVTLGARGAWVQTLGEAGRLVPAPPVARVVDTTAAGDVFNGALAVGLSRGRDLHAAVKFACRAAAISVGRMGAQASAPREGEVVDG